MQSNLCTIIDRQETNGFNFIYKSGSGDILITLLNRIQLIFDCCHLNTLLTLYLAMTKIKDLATDFTNRLGGRNIK